MGVKEAFDRGAQRYDLTRRQLVPRFDDLYGTVLERIPYAPDASFAVLDLGAGTGLLSLFVEEQFPSARLTLIDVSPEMLARAEERFRDDERFRFLVQDYAEAPVPGVFDVVVSALSIHHLSDGDKRRLFERIYAALRPGGVFINADQVQGPTPAVERTYRDAWLANARASGVSATDLAAAVERMEEDRTCSLDTQLSWLREIGFHDVDCWFKHYMFVVFSGTK